MKTEFKRLYGDVKWLVAVQKILKAVKVIRALAFAAAALIFGVRLWGAVQNRAG